MEKNYTGMSDETWRKSKELLALAMKVQAWHLIGKRSYRGRIGEFEIDIASGPLLLGQAMEIFRNGKFVAGYGGSGTMNNLKQLYIAIEKIDEQRLRETTVEDYVRRNLDDWRLKGLREILHIPEAA